MAYQTAHRRFGYLFGSFRMLLQSILRIFRVELRPPPRVLSVPALYIKGEKYRKSESWNFRHWHVYHKITHPNIQQPEMIYNNTNNTQPITTQNNPTYHKWYKTIYISSKQHKTTKQHNI